MIVTIQKYSWNDLQTDDLTLKALPGNLNVGANEQNITDRTPLYLLPGHLSSCNHLKHLHYNDAP